MIKVEDAFNGILLIAPIIIGAYLSGAIAIAKGAVLPVTIFQIALILAFVFFAIKKMLDKNLQIEVFGIEYLLLLFLGLIFFSLIYSPERDQGIFYSIRIVVLVLMTYMIYNVIKTEKEIKILAYVTIGIATIISIHTLLQMYFNPEIIALNYMNIGKNIMRAEGTESDPNIFAINLVLPVLLLIAFFNAEEAKLKKLFLLGLLGIIVATILITYSRSAWVAVFAGVLIVMVYQKKYNLILYGLAGIILLLLFSDTAQGLATTIIERFFDIFAGSSDDSSNIRILLAIGAIRMFFDSYMMGVGFQSFSTYFQNYYTVQETIGVYEPHNEYYAILAELGIIGFILFCFILWKLIKFGIESIKASKKINSTNQLLSIAVMGSFISYLIFYMFYGGMLYNSLFMINIGLMLTLYKINQNQIQALTV